ncbi:dephospho-CoA kinase [Membranihabitans marinus]|uniref:dephospho-CoA kinase n=1 Tax=Membranihabitans marinus TaxID=1227546 RepID=UPI001EEE85F8|nr:dephospho-CoA kinase [Membranihabitans marinus]
MTKIKHFGISGGIGSGKSYCAHFFNLLGISIYSADNRAKLLMRSNPEIKQGLIELFDNKIYLPDGNIDKVRISKALFQDIEIRNAINALVHPIVKLDYLDWQKQQTGPFTLKESALINPDPNIHQLHGIIMVNTPVPIKIQRLMTRDQNDVITIKRKMNSQNHIPELAEVADYSIDNSGTIGLLPQIIEIYNQISQSSKNT